MTHDVSVGPTIQRLDNAFNRYDATRFARYAQQSLFANGEAYYGGEMWLLLLNRWRELTHEVLVTRGSSQVPLDAVSVIIREAFRLRADSMILVHTDPSDYPEPESYDVCMTDSLRRAGDAVRLPLVDHLIVGSDAWYSMREHNWCQYDT